MLRSFKLERLTPGDPGVKKPGRMNLWYHSKEAVFLASTNYWWALEALFPSSSLSPLPAPQLNELLLRRGAFIAILVWQPNHTIGRAGGIILSSKSPDAQ